MNGIKAIRLQLGMSQQAFAEGLEMTQGNVWHYENRGQAVPPSVASNVIDLAARRGFACTFNDIYTDSPTLKRIDSATQAGA